jgi:chromosome segregation ATPase
MATEAEWREQAAALEEMAQVREVLSVYKRHCQAEAGKEEESEAPSSVLETIKSLVAMGNQAASGPYPCLYGDMLHKEEEDDQEDATVQLPSLSEMEKLAAVVEDKDQEVARLVEERDQLKTVIAEKTMELDAAVTALADVRAAGAQGLGASLTDDDGDATVSLDPEVQGLMTSMAERDAELRELQTALQAAGERDQTYEVEVASLQQQLADATTALTGMMGPDQADALRREHEDAVGNLQARVAELEESHAMAEAEVERLVEKQTTTVDKAEVAALEAAHESAWASLQVQLAEAEESKAAALAEIEAVRAAQAGMMGEEDLHALRTNHEDALAELQRRVVDVTEQHAAASKEIQNLVAAQSAMISKGEVQLIQEKHERALAEMQRQIAELEEAKGAAMAEVDSLSTARKTMLDKDEVNCLRLIHEQAIEALRSENKVLEEGKMHAVAEMEKVLAAQRVAEAQVEELREELSGMEAQREELQRRVEAADAEHAALEDEKARHESSLCALRSEIEALREEGSQQMTALQEMVAVLKAQDAEGSALSCDKNLTGESSEDAGPEQGAATVTASLQELVQRLTAANVQLQARATTAEIEARGHAEENAHLKGRVGKFLRRRVSSLPLLEGAEDGHVQVMRAVRRRQGGGTEASNVESNSPSKELNAFAPAEVGEEGVEEAKEAYGLVERMTDMTHEMEQLEEELEGMTEALKGKEAELSEVKAALESKEEDCKRLTIELETATETAHGAEVKAAQKVEEQTERLAAELATARSEIEAFKTIQLAFPNDDVTIAMQQPGEDPPAIAAHEEALEEASKRLEALTTEVAVVKAQLEEKNHEVEKLRCDAFHYQRQFQPIQEKEVDADEKDATVENQNKLQGQLLNEKNARAEAEGQLASAMADFNQTRDDLRRAVERLRASDELLEKTQEAARKERERIENELAVREAEVAALKGEVQELSREVKHAQESLSQRQMAAQGAEQTDESLRKRLSQIQTQLDLAQSLVDRHEARIKELEAENCRVIRVAEDDVQKIRGELERATKGQSQATAREAEVQMLQEAQQALTKKVTLLQAERDDAEQRATAAADALESLEKDMEASRLASAGQEGHVGEMERLRKELQKACEQETESRQEVQEQRVRQKRFQNEVAALQDECSRARDELESVRAELAAATAAQSDQHTAAAAATAEVDMLRKKLAQAQNVEDARTLEVQEACALAKARTNEFALELEGAQARLVAVEAELETTKATAEKADRSRAELLKELNAIFEAKFEAESRVAALEDEIHQLKNKVAEAAGAEAKESEIEELRAALAQKEDDGYRTKRELAELKEAAEAAEEAMGTQQTEVARLQAESRAKDERIRKLDAVKLTTDQVEKLRKIKAEHAQFSTTNKMLRKELEALRQQQEAKTVAPGRSSGQALEAQSHTISDLMATRDSLQEKLHASMAACRKLDLERLSVQETLRELPLFENDGEAGLGFEDDVPDDLGVAVGVVVEKARLRLLAKHASGAHQAEERAMMLKEIETLKVEKDALKARLEDTEAGVDGAHEAEGVFRGKFAAASEKIKALEESNEAAAMKMKEAEMDRQMAAEETARNIRFLEKENLELMMELKKLREQTSKLQAELDRGASSSGLVCGTNALRPIYSQKSNVDAGSSTSQVSAADVNPLKTETTSSSNISCPLPSSKTLPAMTSLSAADKENMMAVGQKLLPVKHDETAPPFQSLADDETHDTNQCKQS